jgi:uncharacterized repeat protein (TIGR02543 family)
MFRHLLILCMMTSLFLLLIACQQESGIPKYEVIFDSNGGTPIESFTIDEGFMIEEPNPIDKTQYIFDGWFKDQEFLNPWIFDVDVVTEDITLYAKWLLTYDPITVNYIHNFTSDGLMSLNYTLIGRLLEQSSKTYTYQSNVLTTSFRLEQTSYISVTTTTDYALMYFVAYNTDTSLSRKIKITSTDFFVEYSVWDSPYVFSTYLGTAGTYRIERGAGHGEVQLMYMIIREAMTKPTPNDQEHVVTIFQGNGEPFSYFIVEHGQRIPELKVPVQNGFQFAGWYQDAGLINIWDFDTPVTDDVYLQAAWTRD